MKPARLWRLLRDEPPAAKTEAGSTADRARPPRLT